MQKRIPLFVVMIVVSVCASAAIASGPYGPPMSLLEHGQWAWDVGYAHEEMNLVGCYGWIGASSSWSDPNGWGDLKVSGGSEECFRMTHFEMDAALASIEYGLCDNWDIFLRLGMAKAEGNIARRDYDSSEERYYWNKKYANFDWGLAWQVGTNFTICQHGPWTWGGRLQYGQSDPDSDSWTERGSYEGDEWRDNISADIEMYQALAYIGPSYQMGDSWLLYSGLGWQCVRMNLDYSCDLIYYDDEYPTSRSIENGTGKLKHSSAIGLFGASWMPNDRARVSADILVGEADKFGWSIVGQFPF